MKNEINILCDKYYNEFVNIREYLHSNPELSSLEFNTTKFIKEKLKDYGVEILDYSLKTGVIGIINRDKEGSTIALRSDIDALPLEECTGLKYESKFKGISHSCGHDIHMSSLLLTSKILSELKDKINGRVIFIFQPAEENLKGSNEIINTNFLKDLNINYILAQHTWPFLESGKIGLLKKEFMASSDFLKIEIIGKAGHGAHPEDCIDPIVISANIITALQNIISRKISPLEGAVLTIGKITGGSAPNIIPDRVYLEGTIRTTNNNVREKIFNDIKTIVYNISKAMGAESKVEIVEGVPALNNDESIVKKLETSSKSILGTENVVYLEKPSMGSEDFSNYLKFIPGAMFRLGTKNQNKLSELGLHNPSVIFDTNSIFVGAKVMSKFILDYLT